MKPNLFMVGAPKCGTTAWVKYLSEHPEVYFSKIKEPHYLAPDLPGIRVKTTEDEYESLFSDAEPAKVVGEASVMYLYSELAAAEIKKYAPDAKILVFLRDRVEFLTSLHQQYLYSFEENIADFESAWRLSGKRPGSTIPATTREPKLLDYKRMANFGEQLQRYASAFPPRQIRIFRYSEWTENPAAVHAEILSFLGLEHDGRTSFQPVNAAKRHRFEWLGRFVQFPPGALVGVVRAAQRLANVDSFGIAESLLRLNRRKTPKPSANAALVSEIRDFYRDDEQLLDKLIAEARAGR
jgi:hypothetical protein